jgi:hypothetical protein
VYDPPVRVPPLIDPAEIVPPEIVALLIVVKPEIACVPAAAVISPVSVNPPMFATLRVLTPNVPLVPLSVKVISAFEVSFLIVRALLLPVSLSVMIGLAPEKVSGEVLDNVNAWSEDCPPVL